MSVLGHFLRWTLGLAGPETQTTPAERDVLAQLARGQRSLAEIGVWHGVTTCRLRSVMAPDGTLFAVDPFPPGRLGLSLQRIIAHREVNRVKNGRVRWLEMTGDSAALFLTTEAEGCQLAMDLVFIDGDHSYEGLRKDWVAWSALIRLGGLVALHDTRSTAARPLRDCGSVRFAQDCIRMDPRFVVVREVDSLTVVQRRLA